MARPRKTNVPRDQRGRIDWRQIREDPSVLTKWNKARDLMLELGSSARLSTQRGKLFCTRQLNSVEFETANRWAEMLERYDRVVLGTRRSPSPPSLERHSPGEASEYDPERIERFRDAFKAAHDVVVSAGKLAEAALNKLCREEASSAALPDARKALAVLSVHFGLAKRGKR